MENRRTAGLLAALSEKDKEITDLKLALKAHTVRTSNVQTRLLATLDALDTLQTSNTQDLAEANRKYRQLKEKMHKYRIFVQECESERDEMREAVNTLVEKVEASNNYALWSHARMQISSHVAIFASSDPVAASASPNLRNDPDRNLLEYAGAVIQALTLERDLEKQEHQHNLRVANARIAILESQLALRECELESCVSHTHECFDSQSFQELETQLASLSREDAIRLLQLASAKNGALDMGNKHMLKRLDIFRTHTSSKVDASCQTTEPKDFSQEKETDATRSPATIVGDVSTPFNFDIESGVKTPVPHSRGPSSFIEDFDREIRELGSKIEAFRAEQTKLVEITRTEKLDQPKPRGYSVRDLVIPPGHDSSRNPSPEPLISPREPKDTSEFPAEQPEPDMPIRELLEQAYKASLQREKSLIEENAKLFNLLRQTEDGQAVDVEKTNDQPRDPESSNVKTDDAAQPPAQHPEIPSVQLLDDDGEMTMDLGTPLLPTPIVLRNETPFPTVSTSSSNSPSQSSERHHDDSPQNANPINPVPHPHPAARQSYSPLPMSPPDSGYPDVDFSFQNNFALSPRVGQEPISEVDIDIDRLESELEEAQKRLADGENAMSDVQDALSILRIDSEGRL
ncbi:hypothetical protein D9758_005002 [Tetrapyrgos nigripes]|uniref:Uncharacterized protein n=1 Tax=Tetrapyrgos nigripes TaxID=182062 RepID=A0A8H5LWT6_9AGAR|nr:hypothetical protein D9758_005002 [Tetrapyrgos nigripes]